MAASAILAIKILADASKANSALADSEAKTSKWSSGLSKAAGVATVGLAAVGAVVLSGVKAAAEDAQAQAVLAKALENSAGASKSAVAETEKWITKTALATGVADDQLRPALGNLVRATGSVEESQKAMALALDISAATGKDVEAVSASLAKGYGGNTAALGKLVPGLDKATLASGDMAAVSDMLASKVGGSAAAAADTAAGQYKIFQVGLDELKEGIGAALLPTLTSLAQNMAGIAKWATENQGKVNLLIAVFAALAAIIVTVNAVTKAQAAIMAVVRTAVLAWQAAQWLLNAALTANPIGLVIVAIALLVAGIVLAWHKSETFREVVTGAFRAVLDVVQNVVGWIRENVGGVISRAAEIAGRAMDILAGNIRSAMSIARAAIQPIITLIESIMDLVGRAASAIRSIPKPSLPDINPFSAPATGGGAAAATTYRGVARAPAAARGTSGSGGPTVIVQGALDPEGVARQIRRILAGHDVRVGNAPVIVR